MQSIAGKLVSLNPLCPKDACQNPEPFQKVHWRPARAGPKIVPGLHLVMSIWVVEPSNIGIVKKKMETTIL